MLARRKDILLPGPPATHPDAGNHHAGAFEHRAPVSRSAELNGRSFGRDHLLDQLLGYLERGRVNINQGKLDRLAGFDQVGNNPDGEHRAAGANQDNFF